MVSRTIFTKHRGRLANAVLACEGRFDFAKFDPMTVQLDLIVHPAKMIDLTIGHDRRKIARAINGDAVPIDERFSIFLWPIQITASHTVACNQQFTRCFCWAKLIVFVDDVNLSVR